MDVKLLSNNIKFKYRVSAIFIYENQLLVSKYGDDTYCLPGGYVRVGENSENALLRELKEELGLDFKASSYAGIIENFFENIKSQKTHEIDLYYYVTLSDYNDFNHIDYNRKENDNGNVIDHNFSWVSIEKLIEIKLLPKEICRIIKNNKTNFHIIVE